MTPLAGMARAREHPGMRSAVVFCCALAFALPAAAQEGDDVAQARQLFQSGLDAAREQHWVEARDAFAQSLALAERPSTLLNLAGAQVQTGQLVEGAASYRRFLELATDGREAAHRAEAESALRTVEPRIPHVTLAVDGLSAADEVRLDDRVLMPAVLGTSMALDPGAHDVTVLREGRSISSQRFQVAEGLDVEIALGVTPIVAAPAAAAAAETTPPMDEAIAVPVHDEPQGDDSGVWIAVGIGVAAVVAIGVVVAVLVATQDQGVAPPYQGNFGAGIVRF